MRDDEWTARFSAARRRQTVFLRIFWAFFAVVACACVAGAIGFVWVAAHFLEKFW